MKKQKSMVLLLIFAMALSLLPQSAFAAKKKVKLNKKTVTVNVGKTVKIKLQNCLPKLCTPCRTKKDKPYCCTTFST